MLVGKDRRTGMVFALAVERKGAADPHAVEQLAAWVDMLGSSQMAIRSDGSAPRDLAGNGLAERAVELVCGMVRTLRNELEFNCQMQIPPESKTIALMIVHATTLLNLDTVGPDGKVPFERWRGRGHHMCRCVFGERVWYRVGPLADRTKADDRMEPGIFVGFRMKSSEHILVANGEATTARTINRRPVQKGGPTLRRSSTYRSGHGTDLDTGMQRQIGPWESGVIATTKLTKPTFPSHLLKQDRRNECT